MLYIIENTYSDLFKFLKKPSELFPSNQNFKSKVFSLFSILLLDILIAFFCMQLVQTIEYFGWFSMDKSLLLKALNKMSVRDIIIAVIIVIPLIEELLFRLYLKYKHNYLLRFVLLIFYVLGKKRKTQIENKIIGIWNNKYPYIFYFSALLFGFIHIFNFHVDYRILLLFPILTSAQISTGVLCAYLRLKYNLFWGYFLHALHNGIYLLSFLLLGNNMNLTEDSIDYFIKIEVAPEGQTSSTAKYYPDSIYMEQFKLADILSYITTKQKFLIESNNEKTLNTQLNLTYKNRADSSFVNKQVIANKLMDLFNFDMHSTTKSSAVWKLHVEDANKLESYRTDSTTRSFTKMTNDSIIIHRGSLATIASTLEYSYSKKVFIDKNSLERYNITIHKTDTTNIKQLFLSNYGIKLVDSTAQLEYLTIDFK